MSEAEAQRRERPIGVFDSGLGGLTVVRALREALPRERIAYLGDTARVPYGSKSGATVERYSKMSARFLLERDIKCLVVACNTASAYALEALVASLPVPVLGVIEPGARAACAASRTGRLGVLGTLGTVRSGSYPRAIAALSASAKVSAVAAPLLVPLAEEGWLGDGDPASPEARAAHAVAERYLVELRDADPALDVIVLGCTHYPLLRPLLSRAAERVFSRPVILVDSAQTMAEAVARALEAAGLLSSRAPLANHEAIDCFVTDDTRLAELGARFLGHPLDRIERVDLAAS